MTKVTKEMRDALRAPLPEKAISKHPTKTYLSSIKAIYVTERLNDVFGVGSWQLRTDFIHMGDGGSVVTKTSLTIPEYGIYLESFGGNDNGGEASKNFDLGDAYKGSTTDAITKICSYLEIGIDVFKGLHGKPSGGSENSPKADAPQTPEKPWLNEKDPAYKEVVEKIKAKTVTIAKVKEHFKLSKATEAKLLTI
jgi:hypothetical protein